MVFHFRLGKVKLGLVRLGSRVHSVPNHCTPSGVPWIQPSSAAPLAPSTSTETKQCSALQRTDRKSSQEHRRDVQAPWQATTNTLPARSFDRGQWSNDWEDSGLGEDCQWLQVRSIPVGGRYAPVPIVLISLRSKPTSLSSRPSSTEHSPARAKRTQEKEDRQWRFVMFYASIKQIT